MKLKLLQTFNYHNKMGQEVEIVDMKRDNSFGSDIAVLTQLIGRKERIWLTIDWFLSPLPQKEE